MSSQAETIGIETALDSLIQRLRPGSRVEKVEAIGSEPEGGQGGTKKAKGYGKPMHVSVRGPDGEAASYVFHTAKSDEFGHNRRSDRAEEMVLAYDTFPSIPGHVPALDVGAIDIDGHLISLRTGSEFYLLTEFQRGKPYADDLRRIAENENASDEDIERCRVLARYLAELHSRKLNWEPGYRRAIRDLVGHGEGIFGMIDGFPKETPAAQQERLKKIEFQCAEWRWKLRGSEQRLSRIHGDFHPFNILFDEDGQIVLLDASRGCQGDPADDVTALAVNYLLFGLEHQATWLQGFRRLWEHFWDAYLGATSDQQLLEVAPPYFAWRVLVLTNPKWYPDMSQDAREALLSFTEITLSKGELQPDAVEQLFQ